MFGSIPAETESPITTRWSIGRTGRLGILRYENSLMVAAKVRTDRAAVANVLENCTNGLTAGWFQATIQTKNKMHNSISTSKGSGGDETTIRHNASQAKTFLARFFHLFLSIGVVAI